ncbi:MAG: type 4a pilus biogenesis protein PilO [Gemmatimonadales bacterium]
MAAFPPADRRGQMLLVFSIVAAASLYFAYGGTPVGGVPGISQLAKTRDSLQHQIDSLSGEIESAQRLIRQGAVAQLERRLAEYRATLDLMRQLVPAGEEIPNLLDDISSRAKVRGANISVFVPGAIESGSPFDTKRARLTATGQFDQIGEFLSDIASLPRIIVPYDLKLERHQAPAADTARNRTGTVLTASFQIRTYVKPPPGDTLRRPAAPRPGAPAAPAAPRRGD